MEGCIFCNGTGWINGHSCPSCNHDHFMSVPECAANLHQIPKGWLICDGENRTPNVTDEGIERLNRLMRKDKMPSHPHTDEEFAKIQTASKEGLKEILESGNK